jgi:hypothetical protein
MKNTAEYALLQHIKFCIVSCSNESQAIRLIEQYGFDKQEQRYSEEEVLSLLNKREDYINSEDNIFEYKSITQWFDKFKKKEL